MRLFQSKVLNYRFCLGQSRFCFASRPTSEPPYLELQRDFLCPSEFFDILKQQEIEFYTGVPDSLLKDFCGYVTDHSISSNHIIAANEGLAVSLAAGYYMASKKIPCVYLQNSGLGNLVNPLMSLAHQQVYGIPMLYLIGWRGEPGKKDEPQHKVQGKTMAGMLTELGLQYEVLPDYIEGAKEVVESAIYTMKQRQAPFALLVRRQTFSNYKLKNKAINTFEMTREQALETIIPELGVHDAIVGTTGFLSRELYEYRTRNSLKGEQDFYCVGSMGHASSIALGISMVKRSKQVFCFDGDGAALMHLGALSTIGQVQPTNYKHIIFNNGAHDSVGAQPSAGLNVDFCQIAIASGYKSAMSVSKREDLVKAVAQLKNAPGPALLEIKIKTGARKDLGRPKSSTKENKQKFMEFLQQ